MEAANSTVSYVHYVVRSREQNDEFVLFKSKLFVDKTQISKILDQQKQLLHHSDGMIFTSEREPYVLGTNNHIMKWKPKEENTVDLAIKLGVEVGY